MEATIQPSLAGTRKDPTRKKYLPKSTESPFGDFPKVSIRLRFYFHSYFHLQFVNCMPLWLSPGMEEEARCGANACSRSEASLDRDSTAIRQTTPGNRRFQQLSNARQAT